MTGDRWQRLDEIFREAIERPAAARADFVAGACAGDDGLRADVTSLLDATGQAGTFLERPAIEVLARDVAAHGWALAPGERVGAYVVEQLLGAGGSGEVWRARDERLGRDVAIKVLLPIFTTDTERLRRFADEARAAGALNHPNVLAAYDVGTHGGAPFIVSECLEGQSLRQRIETGPVGFEEARTVALQIARGLAAAHAKGIVHRDLKPDNVFLRSDGVVKILDFGLAKLDAPLPDTPQTLAGTIVGSAGYMAPEQVRGEAVDGRADLFALGATLYEMLAGRRPFTGASTVETLHAVLTEEPPDVSTLDQPVPSDLGAITMRLLRKAPDARFQSAADLTWALEQAPEDARSGRRGPRVLPPTPAARRPVPATLAWVAVVLVAALAGLAAWPRSPGASSTATVPRITPFTWSLPEGLVLGSEPVPSPDGRRIAFTGWGPQGGQLYVRDLSSLDTSSATPVRGTTGARQPFWSPDGRWLGFFANGTLMKVALPDGVPIPIADAADPRGAAWSTTGTIVFAHDMIGAALLKVSDQGGPATPATHLDTAQEENSHRWPWFLPDGRHYLYFVRSTRDDRRGVYLGRIDATASMPGAPLIRADSNAIYVPPVNGRGPGDLLYVRDGTVEAQAFDADRLRLAGRARSLPIRAAGITPYQPAMLGASREVLAFASTTIPFGFRFGVVGTDGNGLRVSGDRESQGWPRLSPDGRRIARLRMDSARGNPDLWVEDLARGSIVRVTDAADPDMLPVWSPDSTSLAYVTGPPPGRPGTRMLKIAAADGTGATWSMVCPGLYCEPTDWSEHRLFVNIRTESGINLWTVDTRPGGDAQPLLSEASIERDARVSPDGCWIAYVTEESGVPEVSVRSLTGRPRRIAVTGGGGDQPVWRRDRKALYFVDRDGRLHMAPVSAGPGCALDIGVPAALPVPAIGSGHWGTQYDVSADGATVYFLDRELPPTPNAITTVVGWGALRQVQDRE